MPEERSETPNMQYPFVELFTGATVMPLMFANILATWWLLSVSAPWLAVTPTKLDTQSAQKDQPRRPKSHQSPLE
jgi:hypothetical protein